MCDNVQLWTEWIKPSVVVWDCLDCSIYVTVDQLTQENIPSQGVSLVLTAAPLCLQAAFCLHLVYLFRSVLSVSPVETKGTKRKKVNTYSGEKHISNVSSTISNSWVPLLQLTSHITLLQLRPGDARYYARKGGWPDTSYSYTLKDHSNRFP